MAGQAIEAMKFKMLGKSGQADEALESGLAHLSDILEFHVVREESQNLCRVVIGEAQAEADRGGHFHADFDVAIKADTITSDGGRAKRGGLANVVEENTPSQRGGNPGGEAIEHQTGMNPNVALGMILRRLRNTFHCGDFRQELQE